MAPISDSEWADLVAHELPKPSDPVIQKFVESRQALMAEEQKHRSDHSFRQALSPIAKKACDIVNRMRDAERRANRNAKWEHRARIHKVVRRLPKGALLRANCYSIGAIDHLIHTALDTPGMCISSSNGRSFSTEGMREPHISIQFRSKPDSTTTTFWSDDGAGDYTPGTWIPLAHAADACSGGGRDGFVPWLHNIRQSCPESFAGLLHYEPIWRAFLQRLMADLVKDGIYWLELRITFPLAYYRDGSEEPDQDYDNMFQAIEEEVAKFKATDAGSQFWGLRVIWRMAHSSDLRSKIENADDCIATKLVWRDLVGGFDVEDRGKPLTDTLPALFWFRQQCVSEGVQIPFLLCANDHATADDSLADALLLGTRRMGNAISLPRHPRLLAAVRDKRILAELNPMADDTRTSAPTNDAHAALSILVAQGVPCALGYDCPKDSPSAPNAESPSLMTETFWGALRACDETDLATLGSLAENSVRWANFEDQDAEAWARDIRAASVGAGVKAARLQQWAVEWERFCLWVVTEYGDKYDAGNTDDIDTT